MRKESYLIDKPTWCKGCGLFGILEALKRAAAALSLQPENMVIVTGIGCHGRLNNHFNAYGYHGLHGRVLPTATGIKLSHSGLTVLGVSGDGDGYSIGMGHFIHAVRKNVGLTYIVANNRIYGLTQGQTSPTSELGFCSISTPFGSKEHPVDGLKVALGAEGTYISRGFSGNVPHLEGLLRGAVLHRGFALVEVLSPCVTHNKVNTYDWFRKHIRNVDQDPDHDPGDKESAWRSLTAPDRIPVGLLYKEEKASYEEEMLKGIREPLARLDLEPDRAKLEKVMEKFQ